MSFALATIKMIVCHIRILRLVLMSHPSVYLPYYYNTSTPFLTDHRTGNKFMREITGQHFNLVIQHLGGLILNVYRNRVHSKFFSLLLLAVSYYYLLLVTITFC